MDKNLNALAEEIAERKIKGREALTIPEDEAEGDYYGVETLNEIFDNLHNLHN